MINGIVFDNRYVRSKDMAVALQSAIPDGICTGCSLTYQGAVLTIGTGFMIAAGRLIQVIASETFSMSQASGYARIKLVIDLSNESTTDTFEQAYFAVEYAQALTGFSELIQGDINAGSDLIYEMEVCILTLETSGISGFERQNIHTGTDMITVGGKNYKIRSAEGADAGLEGYITLVKGRIE